MTSDDLYAVLLRLYPASFRARFGHDMRRTFAADRARAHGAGRRSAGAFWIRTATR